MDDERARGQARPASIAAHEPGLSRKVAALAGLSLSACLALTDTEQVQCKENGDCVDRFGPLSTYLCREQTCVRTSCATDDDCRQIGGTFLTSICGEDLRCDPPECMVETDCTGGRTCDPTRNRCVARECASTADCAVSNPSPTVECVAGSCVDETWGCIGRPDDRPPATMATGTLRVQLIDGVTRTGISGATLRACGPVTYDACTRSLTGVAINYDTSTGQAVFNGIPTTVGGLRIQLDPPPGSGLIPLDFYSQRPVRDVSVASAPVVTVERAVSNMVGSVYDPPIVIRSDVAGVNVAIFDCKDQPAAGVKLDFVNQADRLADTRITYFSANLQPDPNRTVTDTPGAATILNLKSDKAVALTTSINGKPISEISLPFATGRITNLHFYPRNYGMQ